MTRESLRDEIIHQAFILRKRSIYRQIVFKITFGAIQFISDMSSYKMLPYQSLVRLLYNISSAIIQEITAFISSILLFLIIKVIYIKAQSSVLIQLIKLIDRGTI